MEMVIERKRENIKRYARKKRERRDDNEGSKRGEIERKVWELVNKERKRRRRINEDIKMEEWKEYFMEQLGGVGESHKGNRKRE